VKRITILVILFTLSFLYGCKKDDPQPEAPVITFVDLGLAPDGNSSIVKFEFFDGDGDLGLKQEENTGTQQFNLFVDYLEFDNGVWKVISPIIDSTFNFELPTPAWEYDTMFFHARIPFIENETNLSLEGEMVVNLFFNPALANTAKLDTFRYEIYMKDRALHPSNKIRTSNLVVK
jgi:hypothetical protein